MTPGGRLAAAIEILDEVVAGGPAERCLTRWARGHRFAGSKDRAAIRDLVFDVLRTRASSLWCAGRVQETGRALIVGHLSMSRPEALAEFNGQGFSPAPLTPAEAAGLRDLQGAPDHVAEDWPAFLLPELTRSLGGRRGQVAEILRTRAPVDLRVNSLRGTTESARIALANEGVETHSIDDVPDALRVRDGARLVARSEAYRSGLVELQDAASQVVALSVGAAPDMTVLDLCAGGGGKTLALSAGMLGRGRLFAFDANPGRMRDIPARAARAGATVEIIGERDITAMAGQFDRVLADVPCSGSGAWRRNPDQKWKVRPGDLQALVDLQDQILDRAVGLLRPGGRLILATCSVLQCENEDQADKLLARNTSLTEVTRRRLWLEAPGDGFFYTIFELV